MEQENGRAGEVPQAETDPPEGSGEAAGPDPLKEIGGVLRSSGGLLRDMAELLAVEGRLAGRSLVMMLCLAIVLALIVVSVWLLANAALAAWAVESQWLNWPAALAVMTLVNVAVAWALWITIGRLSRNLAFPGVVGGLRSMTTSDRKSEKSS